MNAKQAAGQSMVRRVAFGAALFIAIPFFAAAAVAQTTNWNGGAGNWSNSSDWSAGVPTSTSTANIVRNTSTAPSAVFVDVNAAASVLNIGPDDGSSSLTIGSGNTLTVGDLTSFDQLTLDSGSTLVTSQPSYIAQLMLNSGAIVNAGDLETGGSVTGGTLNTGALGIETGSQLTVSAGSIVNAGDTTDYDGLSIDASTWRSGSLDNEDTLQLSSGSAATLNGDFDNGAVASLNASSMTVNGNLYNFTGSGDTNDLSISSGSVLNVTGTFNNENNNGNGEFGASFEISGGSAVKVGGDFDNVGSGYLGDGGGAQTTISGASVLSVGGNLTNQAGPIAATGFTVEGGSVVSVAGNLNNAAGFSYNFYGVPLPNPASFTIEGGSVVTVQGTVTNSGDISIDNTSVLNAHSGFTQTAGSTVVDGLLSAAGTGVSIQGGSLSGTGTINGNVANGGVLTPGDAPGTLTINGNYTQLSTGTLMEEIASFDPGIFSNLQISGLATLDGTLDIDLLDGFMPTAGESFEIMEFGSLDGEFSGIDGANIGDGLQFEIFYDPHDIRLVAAQTTPEPESFLLLGIGLFLLAGFSRRWPTRRFLSTS